jgi:hypothetical protein
VEETGSDIHASLLCCNFRSSCKKIIIQAFSYLLEILVLRDLSKIGKKYFYSTAVKIDKQQIYLTVYGRNILVNLGKIW